MLSVKQGNYWYHFYNVFWYDAVLDLGLNPEPPALDVSTLPLGYRGGGTFAFEVERFCVCLSTRHTKRTSS